MGGCGCSCGGGCGPGPCPTAPRSTVFTVPTAQCYAGSLARKLIGPADKLRNLEVRFGLRPYIVRLVRLQWSGGRRGIGEDSVIPEPEILLPVPLLVDLKTLTRVTSPIGTDENGGVIVTEISGCYTEDQLRGKMDGGGEIPADQSFFYEIEFLRADGQESTRRRFFPAGAPEYSPDNFSWTIKLERQRPDRQRDGSPRG